MCFVILYHFPHFVCSDEYGCWFIVIIIIIITTYTLMYINQADYDISEVYYIQNIRAQSKIVNFWTSYK
jgi:hypothetical protein